RGRCLPGGAYLNRPTSAIFFLPGYRFANPRFLFQIKQEPDRRPRPTRPHKQHQTNKKLDSQPLHKSDCFLVFYG
ncbi:hypothetical protein, partial [Enterobacter intestinihominis]